MQSLLESAPSARPVCRMSVVTRQGVVLMSSWSFASAAGHACQLPGTVYLAKGQYAAAQRSDLPLHVDSRGSVGKSAIQTFCLILCSGDYGIGFFGLSHNMGAYLVKDHLGMDWLCFLCKIEVQHHRDCTEDSHLSRPSTSPSDNSEAAVKITAGRAPCEEGTRITMWPTDAYRRRVFLQPWGLYLIAEAGSIESVQIDVATSVINVTFEAHANPTSSCDQLRVEQTSDLEQHQDVRGGASQGCVEHGSDSNSCSGVICVARLADEKQRYQPDASRRSRAVEGEALQKSDSALATSRAACSTSMIDQRTFRQCSGKDLGSSIRLILQTARGMQRSVGGSEGMLAV